MFRLIVNIGGVFDLYCSPSASDALRNFVPRANHQSDASAILNVDTIRSDETADYGRARYIQLLTEVSLSKSQRSLIRRNIENALDAELDRIMAAKNRDEISIDRRRIRHVCDQFDSSWLKSSKYATENPRHFQEDRTDPSPNGSKAEGEPQPTRTVANEPAEHAARAPSSSSTPAPPRGSTTTRRKSSGFLANAILTTIIVTIGVAVVFFFVYPSHDLFKLVLNLERRIAALQRSVNEMQAQTTDLAYKSDVVRIDSVLVSLSSNIKSLESVVLEISDSNIPNSLASSISTLKSNVADLRQRMAYLSNASQEGSLAYTVNTLRSEVRSLRRGIRSVLDPSNAQSLVTSMRTLESSLARSSLLANEIHELEADLKRLGRDVTSVRIRILGLSDSTASGSLAHLVGSLASELNILRSYVSELIHTANAASLVDAVARLESDIEMLSHRTQELADATSPGSLSLNIQKLESNIGYLQGELQRVASTLNEYPGSGQSSATTESDGAASAYRTEDLPDDAARDIVSLGGAGTSRDVAEPDSDDTDSGPESPKNGNGATTVEPGTTEDEGEGSAVVSPEVAVSPRTTTEGPGKGVDSAGDDTTSDVGTLDREGARTGSGTKPHGEATTGDPRPDAEDPGSDDETGAPGWVSEVPVPGMEESTADSGDAHTEADSESGTLQRTSSSTGDPVARDSSEAAEAALKLEKRDRRLVQCALSELGHYSHELDGRYGRHTRNAIRDYETQEELGVTGYLTRPTFDALKKVAADSQCDAKLDALDKDSGGSSD